MMKAKFEKFMRESNAIESEVADTLQWRDVPAYKGSIRVEEPTTYRIHVGALHARDIEAMEYMHSRASQREKMTEYDLLEIHAMLAEHRDDLQDKGKYRTMDVMVGRHRGTPWKNVPHAMEDFFLHYPMMSPWKAHMLFEKIHPFEDLNGRTGRILWAWKMLETGEDPYRIPFLQRYYYQTLDASR